jgi:hypothetical protein
MSTKLKVQNFRDANVDNPKKALIASFELALVEYLNGDYRRIFDSDVEVFVPIGVEGAFDDAGAVGLLSVNGYDGERIWQAEDVALGESVRGNNSDTNLSR